MKFVIIFILALAHTVAGQVTCPGSYIPIGTGCYTFLEEARSWFDSSHICQFSGGYLVKIQSSQEQNALKAYFDTNLGNSSYTIRWIGASDSVSEGIWRWVPTGETLLYENWAQGFPSDTEPWDCAYWFVPDNAWWNSNCCAESGVIAPICEADPLSTI